MPRHRAADLYQPRAGIPATIVTHGTFADLNASDGGDPIRTRRIITSLQSVLISWQETTLLGGQRPVVEFGYVPLGEQEWGGTRMFIVDDGPGFYLTYPCRTCPILFERIAERPQRTLSLETMQQRLNEGLEDIDPTVVQRFGDLLPEGPYLATLLEVQPQLVLPDTDADYFTHELPASWGDDGSYVGRSADDAYYRTFSTAVAPEADDPGQIQGHLYEFVVPMVPPAWNDPDRVSHYRDRLTEAMPTAVAVSVLETPAPVRGGPNEDYYYHWGLIHFLLDGHHKFQAAAETGQPVRLLSLLAVDKGVSSPDDIRRLPAVRSQAPSTRS